jgi:hypothetical protein
MGSPTKDLQDFFLVQRQQNNTKEFNFKIWNYFNMFITKHEPPYIKQSISSSFFDQIECFLYYRKH